MAEEGSTVEAVLTEAAVEDSFRRHLGKCS